MTTMRDMILDRYPSGRAPPRRARLTGWSTIDAETSCQRRYQSWLKPSLSRQSVSPIGKTQRWPVPAWPCCRPVRAGAQRARPEGRHRSRDGRRRDLGDVSRRPASRPSTFARTAVADGRPGPRPFPGVTRRPSVRGQASSRSTSPPQAWSAGHYERRRRGRPWSRCRGLRWDPRWANGGRPFSQAVLGPFTTGAIPNQGIGAEMIAEQWGVRPDRGRRILSRLTTKKQRQHRIPVAFDDQIAAITVQEVGSEKHCGAQG